MKMYDTDIFKINKAIASILPAAAESLQAYIGKFNVNGRALTLGIPSATPAVS